MTLFAGIVAAFYFENKMKITHTVCRPPLTASEKKFETSFSYCDKCCFAESFMCWEGNV